jgi:16S rRNA processing protein RimM
MLLVVGQIVRPHGIRGEVMVDVRTDEPAQRFAAGSVLVADPPAGAPTAWAAGRLTVEAARPHQGRLIVAFDGIVDRTVAEDLRGVLLMVDSADVPPSDDPDEFHDHDLVGLVAVSPGGERFGEIERIEHAPASDLLVLRRPEGGTALVPFVKAIVPEVDLAGGRVVVTPPEGLFDL